MFAATTCCFVSLPATLRVKTLVRGRTASMRPRDPLGVPVAGGLAACGSGRYATQSQTAGS